MPLASTHHRQDKTRAVPILVLAALGVMICVGAAGWLHYSAAVHLNQSRDWLEHSQAVVSNLQLESQRLDRIEPTAQLYFVTHGEDKLRAIQSNAVAFYSNALRIEQLVADNSSQAQLGRTLEAQAAQLQKTLGDLTPQAAFPAREILACRETLSLMQTAERELLTQRTETAKANSNRSLIISVGFTALSLALVAGLFGFLLRDAFRRRRYEQQLFEANEKLNGTIRALERQARESNLLTSARDELQLCVSPEEAQRCAARYFGQLLPATSGGICIINNSRQVVELASVWNDSTILLDGFSLDACCGLRSGRVRWRKSGQSEVHCSHFNGTPPENYLCLPLAAHGETLGIIYVECSSAGVAAMVEAQSSPLHELVELSSMAIAGLNLRSKLEHQSIRDGLTGLFNRHFMEIALDRELHRATRQQKSLAILMLDVDHFKKFNDTFGHEAGDNVLRQVAEVFRQTVRNEDIICRYGGEEFVILLPEVSIDGAMERAETLRRMVSEIRSRHHGEGLGQITISIGVAIFPQHADTLETILRAADRALYEAKHQGRNCVVIAEQSVSV